MVTTLCFALLVHGLVIFGVAFTADDPAAPSGEPTLEVVLVNAPTDEPPDLADYISDASQRGAGNVDEPVRLRSPESTPGNPDAIAERARDDTPSRSSDTGRDGADTRPAADSIDDPLLTTEAAAHVRLALMLRAGAGGAQPAQYGTDMLLPSIPAETDAHTALAYSRNPRERFISVNTQEAVYAAYMDAWRARVERVGNLNYPDEARRSGLSGVLSLEVVIDAEGRVRHLLVRESSGYRMLDDAALRIVYLASPFEAFPDALRAETDALRFVYEWEFGGGRNASRVRSTR